MHARTQGIYTLFYKNQENRLESQCAYLSVDFCLKTFFTYSYQDTSYHVPRAIGELRRSQKNAFR